MASIVRETTVDLSPELVWNAIRDVGAVHTRLAPGFVTDTKMEEGARVVTFHNGLVARELIVTVDEASKRLVWAVVGTRLTHHNASLQVFPESAGSSRVVWIADLLPNDLDGMVTGMIEDSMRAMKQTLESQRT
jgi:Polyketide cyclase / dehydrase and lipid transport